MYSERNFNKNKLIIPNLLDAYVCREPATSRSDGVETQGTHLRSVGKSYIKNLYYNILYHINIPKHRVFFKMFSYKKPAYLY